MAQDPRLKGERIAKLEAMLQRTPDDPFLLYCLAMEHKKAQDVKQAVELFDRVTMIDMNYCAAYHMKAQTLENAGDFAGAKQAYRDGIQAAERKGDDHARGEMAAALSMLEDM